jgi:peptide/nickel transport system permease protein
METKVDTSVLDQVNEKTEEVISPWKIAWKRLKRYKLAMVGMFVLLFLAIASIAGPFLSPYRNVAIDLVNQGLPPSWHHLLGTDDVGRDILTRVLYAGRISLAVGVVAVTISVLIGSTLGVIAGYYGGIVDSIIMRVVDIIMCFPYLGILIVLSAMMSDLRVPPDYRIFVLMFMIGVISWPGLCRIIRGQILSFREQEFMQAAEALGLKDRRKMFSHLLPNTFASVIVYATLGVGDAILAESALSFLGLGVTPPTPSWGQMVQVVDDLYIIQYMPWKWIPPGLCILLTVLSINLFGDGLRDALDPKLKG